MDGRCFDRLTRTLAKERSRRSVLGSLLALGAGLLGIQVAEAACPSGQVRAAQGCVCKLNGRPPVNGICPCPARQTDTGDGQGCLECRSLAECPPSDACTSYACVAGECDRSRTRCPDTDPCTSGACDPALGCVTTPVPDNNQGDCAGGSVCCAGRGCTPLGTTGDCTACGDACTDPTPFCSDTLGCVTCLTADDCGTCQTCENGACVVDGSSEARSCPSEGEFGAICCGGVCVDLPDDQDRLCCGTETCLACATSADCDVCEDCLDSVCIARGDAQPCPSGGEFGAICCNGACIDLPDDQDRLCCGTETCLACATSEDCPEGEICDAGVCIELTAGGCGTAASCGGANGCFAVGTTEGRDFCAADFGCATAVPCGTSSDCPPGPPSMACVTNTCCGATPLCAVVCAAP